MGSEAETQIVLEEGRFGRFEAIPWWDQSVLREARVLVVGAGALGNEVIKNLALLGVGHLAVADMDSIERTNLCRSVLFRQEDEGAAKATTAVAAAEDLYHEIHATALVGNILADVGLGCFRWAQVVVGCLDNREARVFVNRACTLVGRPWIDGGIEVLNGIVRGFSPPASACYECTMGQADWDLLNKRRSCSLLARNAASEGGTPTTPTSASVIGAIQAQEVVKRLHGLDSLAGRGFVFEGLAHNSYTVDYPIAPDCPWHENPAPIEPFADLNSDTRVRTIWARASEKIGELDAIDLARELVERLECTSCGQSRRLLRSIEHVREDQVHCDACRAECVPHCFHGLSRDSDLLDLTVRELGLPPWDIVWGRHGERVLGIELAGDRPADGAWT